MAFAPVVLDTVQRCKICSSPARDEVNVLIGRWKVRDITKEELLEQMAALGLENPNLDNVKGHVGTKEKPKHVKFVDAAEVAADEELQDAARDAVIEGLRERIAAGEQIDADAVLDMIIELGMSDLEFKVQAGKFSGITVDQILKAVSEKTKRKHNVAQQELLGALTGGIGQVFQKALGGGAAGELEAGPEVIEAEFTEVEE